MENKVIEVKVKGGVIRATASADPNYPGIDVEFVPDNENEDALSNPRVLVEFPNDEEHPRALIWDDSSKEDYNVKIVFD
jgi:hypothetical protein